MLNFHSAVKNLSRCWLLRTNHHLKNFNSISIKSTIFVKITVVIFTLNIVIGIHSDFMNVFTRSKKISISSKKNVAIVWIFADITANKIIDRKNFEILIVKKRIAEIVVINHSIILMSYFFFDRKKNIVFELNRFRKQNKNELFIFSNLLYKQFCDHLMLSCIINCNEISHKFYAMNDIYVFEQISWIYRLRNCMIINSSKY